MRVVMIIGSVGSFLSLILALFCTIFYEWKRRDDEASQGSLQDVYHAEGLWIRCSSAVPGMMACDYYDTTIFDVPGRAYMLLPSVWMINLHLYFALETIEVFLQVVRAFAILSCILLLCSSICDILALDIVTHTTRRTKVWLARMGGGFSIVAGILLITAVSWYAAMVIQEFNDAFNYVQQGFLYTFGAALYVGWVAGSLALICGAIVLFLGRGSKLEDEDDDRATYYSYTAPRSRVNEEYV